MLMEICHRLSVNLHNTQFAGFLRQILCEDTHAGSHLKDGNVGAGIHRVGNGLCHIQVDEEMLPKVLFRFYILHIQIMDVQS